MHKMIVWGACLLAGCANACDESANRAHRTQQVPSASEATQPPSEVRTEVPVDATLVSPKQLATLLVDRIGDFEATGSATTTATHLPSGNTLPQARRNYRRGNVDLEIEVMDTLYTPAVGAIVKRAQTMKRETATNLMMGFQFKGNPAVKQWTKVNDTARVGTLIGERLILNVNVTPASSPDIALAVAQNVDYEAANALLGAVEKHNGKLSDAGTPKKVERNAALMALAIEARAAREAKQATEEEAKVKTKAGASGKPSQPAKAAKPSAAAGGK